MNFYQANIFTTGPLSGMILQILAWPENLEDFQFFQKF